MEITKEVVVPAQPEKVRTEKSVLCDFCKRKAERKCCLCDRDVCGNHFRYDPDEGGDYPDRYCRACFDLKYTGHYRMAWLNIGEVSDKAYEEIDQIVKQESLAKKRPTRAGMSH